MQMLMKHANAYNPVSTDEISKKFETAVHTCSFEIGIRFRYSVSMYSGKDDEIITSAYWL